MSRRAAVLLGVGIALAAACAGGLPPRDPLADLHPYLWLREGRLRGMTCRFADGMRVTLAAEAGARPEDEALLATARQALAGLGLPLTFALVEPEAKASVRVRFEDAAVARAAGEGGSGRSDAVCAYDPSTGRAALAAATLRVGRTAGPDARGRVRALSRTERLGALLHELGHALGFQGHPRFGDPLLAPEPEAVHRLGRRVARGERPTSPGLRALYALPSGHLVLDLRVDPWRGAPVDALAAQARRRGWVGPYLRVGDRAARISWLADEGREPAVALPEIERILRRPTEVLAIPVQDEAARGRPGAAAVRERLPGAQPGA